MERKKKINLPKAVKCKDTPQSISPLVRNNWSLGEYSGKYQMLTFFMYSSLDYCQTADIHSDIVGTFYVPSHILKYSYQTGGSPSLPRKSVTVSPLK